jgi:hypothetical protein
MTDIKGQLRIYSRVLDICIKWMTNYFIPGCIIKRQEDGEE